MKKVDINEPFPEFIMGDNMYLQMHHSDDDNRIAELVNMVVRNKDFFDYLYLTQYLNVDSAKKYITKREQMAKQGLLVDYAIQLFSGKIVGGINFTNRNDKSVGVTCYMDKQYRRMGFISKSLKIAEPELARLGFEKIILEINETNENSIRVALKNNYIFQETGWCMKNYVKDLRNLSR